MCIGFECEMFPYSLSLQLVGLSGEALGSRRLVLDLSTAQVPASSLLPDAGCAFPAVIG